MSRILSSPPLAPPLAVTEAHDRRLLRDTLWVGGTTIACQALGVLTSLLLRGLLHPAQMGVWQALKMFLGYSNYLNLGISKSATRDWSVARGHGDTSRAAQGLNLAFSVNLLTSVGYGAVLVVAGAWVGLRGGSEWSPTWGVGLAALGLLVVAQRHVTFHTSVLRAEQRFATTSRLSIVEAVLTLTMACGGAYLGELPGLYAGTLCTMLGSWIYLKYSGARRFTCQWERREISRLIGSGAPMMLSGVVLTLFRSLDKLWLLAEVPDREFQLGCYSLALLVGGQIYGLGNMLATVHAPRYGALYGATGSRATVARAAARSSEPAAALLALCSGTAMVAGPPLLAGLFPEYSSGASAIAWTCLGATALALAQPALQYLSTVDRQRQALRATVVATAFACLADYLALANGGGLWGLSLAMALAQAVYWALTLAAAFGPDLDRPSWRRFAIRHTVLLVPTLGTAWLLEVACPVPMVRLVGVAGVWWASVCSVWPNGSWRSVWRGGGSA